MSLRHIDIYAKICKYMKISAQIRNYIKICANIQRIIVMYLVLLFWRNFGERTERNSAQFCASHKRQKEGNWKMSSIIAPNNAFKRGLNRRHAVKHLAMRTNSNFVSCCMTQWPRRPKATLLSSYLSNAC